MARRANPSGLVGNRLVGWLHLENIKLNVGLNGLDVNINFYDILFLPKDNYTDDNFNMKNKFIFMPQFRQFKTSSVRMKATKSKITDFIALYHI